MLYPLPHKDKASHKGEYGRVLIVGGSNKYYGAPIITALAAEKSGADLITLWLPQQYLITAQQYSLNLFLNSYVQGNLGLKDIGLITQASKNNHVMIIGNGIGQDSDTQKALLMILQEVEIPLIIDAEALIPQILTINKKAPWIITPHTGEFKRLFGVEADKAIICEKAKEYNLTIVVKGQVDYIADTQRVYENTTGCPQMRVGGTGDALAGIIGSYVAQGLDLYTAAKSACYYFGRAGELLASNRQDFSSYDLMQEYPFIIMRMLEKL